jgi:hypothetical protein
LHGIKIKILKAEVDPEAVEIQQQTWVKIYGLPGIACKEGIVMKVAALPREPVVVDQLSPIKAGPVRVKINCIDPKTLRGFIKIFFQPGGIQHQIHIREV